MDSVKRVLLRQSWKTAAEIFIPRPDRGFRSVVATFIKHPLELQIFMLLRIAESCNLPADRNLPRYELDIKYLSFHRNLTSSDTSRASIRLRGALSRRDRNTEILPALSKIFVPSARLLAAITLHSNLPTFNPPPSTSMLEIGLRQYHEGRAAARMQYGRPPKLSRSFKVNTSISSKSFTKKQTK
jgi:hypothetical protein